jgi:hypothetical protein
MKVNRHRFLFGVGPHGGSDAGNRVRSAGRLSQSHNRDVQVQRSERSQRPSTALEGTNRRHERFSGSVRGAGESQSALNGSGSGVSVERPMHPKEHRFLRNLVESYPEFRVAYTRLVVICTDNPLNLNEFRDSLGAPWPFLGDPARTVQHDLDIEEFTDPHNPMIPHTFVLEPGLRIFSIYNGYWYWGRPTMPELHVDLRVLLQKIRPDLIWAHQGFGRPGIEGTETCFSSTRSMNRSDLLRARPSGSNVVACSCAGEREGNPDHPTSASDLVASGVRVPTNGGASWPNSHSP